MGWPCGEPAARLQPRGRGARSGTGLPESQRMEVRIEHSPTRGRAGAAKVTGERVATPAGGFNPTWQRHVAAYALSAPCLGPGRVLDLGCGIGHSYHLLAPRETVGVDIDPAALAGQERPTVVADMRELPFGNAEFASVLSVQSLEHVPDPESVLAEAARVLEPGGQTIFVTPNRLTLGRPDEIIDPYHYVEFDHRELRALCEREFGEVTIRGLFGSPRYMELYARGAGADGPHPRARPAADAPPACRAARASASTTPRFVAGGCGPTPEPPQSSRPTSSSGTSRSRRRSTCSRSAGRRELEAPEPDRADERARGRLRRPAPGAGRSSARAPSGRAAESSALGCGAATTDPCPTESELAAAYGDWYRPRGGGRFHFGLATRCSPARARSSPTGSTHRAAGAGPRRRRGRGHAGRRPARDRAPGDGHRARAAPRRPARRAAREPRGRDGRRSSSGTPSST